MQKQEFETIISEQLTLFNNLKEEFISQKDFEMAVSMRGIEKYLIDIQKIMENKREIPEFEVFPNFFKSNYSIGRFHTAMIAYIIELWNREGSNLANIIFEDHFEIGKKYYPRFEYDSIDLVIFEDKDYERPTLFIEMKVYDYESWSQSQQSHQLKIYSKRIKEKFGENSFKKFFFTLGTSQYSGVPSCNKWKQFTLDSLIEKLNQYEGEDMLIKHWRSALGDEYNFKNTVFKNGYLRNDLYKNKAQLYRLGQLGELLKDKYPNYSVFSFGSKPDLILNFGYNTVVPFNPFYIEITDNMKLNLKVNFNTLSKFLRKDDKSSKNHLEEQFEKVFSKKIIPKNKQTQTLLQMEIFEPSENSFFLKSFDEKMLEIVIEFHKNMKTLLDALEIK